MLVLFYSWKENHFKHLFLKILMMQTVRWNWTGVFVAKVKKIFQQCCPRSEQIYVHSFHPILNCGFCLSRILLYFPPCVCVCHRRDISVFLHCVSVKKFVAMLFLILILILIYIQYLTSIPRWWWWWRWRRIKNEKGIFFISILTGNYNYKTIIVRLNIARIANAVQCHN